MRMSPGNIFKLSLYSLTALAGWILGSAEEGWIPYGSLPFVLVGFLWSEGGSAGNRRGISDTIASICGFISLCIASIEFFSENVEGRLLSGTHLVVYLTWIVLLQAKTTRQYWQLLALGVLQLAVASVLTSGRATIWFGFCAVLYFCGAIWTLSIFSLHRSATLMLESSSQVTGPDPSPVSAHSTATGSIQMAGGSSWITAPFVAGVLFTSLTGLFVSALFFALIPRVWIPTAGALASEDSSGAGISRTVSASGVRLGDMGPVLESLDPVLQVRFWGPDRKPLDPQAYAEQLGLPEPLFRVNVLSIYKPPHWRADTKSIQKADKLIPPQDRRLVRQEIRLEEIGTEALPCMGMPLGLVDHERIPRGNYQSVTGIMYRDRRQNARGTIRYSVFSESPPPGVSLDGRSAVSDLVLQTYSAIGYVALNSQLPTGLRRLDALASQVIDKEQKRRGRDLTQLEKARAIESHLRDSGEYSYSLSLSIDDSTIDPVEDFLFNRKQGHCEYFASALVLMLRSAGIPARLISGYKGGNYDANSGVLHVQQRHAHAWCEAWIDNRYWVTLDATPYDERTASVESIASNRSVWSDMRAQLTGIWSENVVNISLEQQEETIYRPIRELIQAAGRALKEFWESPRQGLTTFLQVLIDPRRWLSPAGAGTLFLVVSTIWLLRRLWKRVRWRGWGRNVVEDRSQHLVEFYERFTRLMQTVNLQRSESQTQQEFAREASVVLEPRLQMAGLACGPTEITDLFYKVRFGAVTLPENEISRVDELLTSLEKAFQKEPLKG